MFKIVKEVGFLVPLKPNRSSNYLLKNGVEVDGEAAKSIAIKSRQSGMALLRVAKLTTEVSSLTVLRLAAQKSSSVQPAEIDHLMALLAHCDKNLWEEQKVIATEAMGRNLESAGAAHLTTDKKVLTVIPNTARDFKDSLILSIENR